MSEVSLTSKMIIDILSVKNEKYVLENFPQLNRVKEFVDYAVRHPQGPLNSKHVIMYVVLLYSKDSILNTNPPTPLQERKHKAADLVGIKRNANDNFTQDVTNKLFNLQDEEILACINGYLKLQNDFLIRDIYTTEQEIDELFRLRLKPVSDEKDKDNIGSLRNKAALGQLTNEKRKHLEGLYKELYAGHEDLRTVNENKIKAISLEDLAE